MKKEAFFEKGLELLKKFCFENKIEPPPVTKTSKDNEDRLLQRYYYVGSCAFYRPVHIYIAVDRCANLGYGGMAWSWPSYCVDRTPYGVLQHELGHHIDFIKSSTEQIKKEDLFSYRLYQFSKEKPMTGYLGTDKEDRTFFMEWFAENFRLFVTNPDLCNRLRPRFFKGMLEEKLNPVVDTDWGDTLRSFEATERIISQAGKKIRHIK